MSDSGHTPHVVVDATMSGVVVPEQHVSDGKIILNISFSAAHGLDLKNDKISFRARFGGRPFDVSVPIRAILGIYARETGQGMIFSAGGDQPPPPTGTNDSDERPARRGAHLKLIK